MAAAALAWLLGIGWQLQQPALWPQATRPELRYTLHFHRPGPGLLPLAPAWLELSAAEIPVWRL